MQFLVVLFHTFLSDIVHNSFVKTGEERLDGTKKKAKKANGREEEEEEEVEGKELERTESGGNRSKKKKKKIHCKPSM